ncbi:UDP-N-acetylglucosamine 1-carboxyvinyltransferase [Candidatus Fermentibacteria bacterium]|nr:UDP-N-acetylglucosamine 1-carboxyvinyltransferase [Candidatus Fermentibacteria bacterium]
MSVFRIEGGVPLSGTIIPRGNKNEALPALAAALLTADEVVLDNVPRIADIATMVDLMRGMGAVVEWVGAHRLRVQASSLMSEPDAGLCGQIRGSFLLASPLLAREWKARLPSPGGDKIGRRRLDPHLSALSAMGVSWHLAGSTIDMSVGTSGFRPAAIELDEPGVTATENALMLASCIDGETTIYPAACEPHVQGLCRMLSAMGADIVGVGTNRLTVRGTWPLHGCNHTISADHIEIGSFIGLAAATGSLLAIDPVDPALVGPVLRPFRKLGISFTSEGSTLQCDGRQGLTVEPELGGAVPVIDDGPWPAVPADVMSILVVTATQAQGTVLVFEKMFESRLFWVDRLIAMGANAILCDPHRVVVVGPSRLHGTTVASPDIRAGMALVIAALAAEGTSIIQNVSQIDRGYETIDERLAGLGARILREE